MQRPIDAFIIGTQKGGTTTVFEVLREHPDVYAPWVKENHFFTNDAFWAQGPRYLDAFYPERVDAKVVLGAYAHAMAIPGTERRLIEHNPGIHAIAVLRDPVDRAWSAFWFARRNGWEPLEDFDAALAAEPARAAGSRQERAELTYLGHGEYAAQLLPYVEALGRDRVHVVFMEELKRAPEAAYARLCAGLGLSLPDSLPIRRASNPAGRPRLPWLQRVMLRDAAWKGLVRRVTTPRLRARLRRRLVDPVLAANVVPERNPAMDPATRERLRAHFAPHDAALAALLGIHAPPWR